MKDSANALLIHPADNVAVALGDIAAGSVVSVNGPPKKLHISAQQAVPFGHKIAVKPIAQGEAIVKYGAPVACATSPVEVGAWVHMHNARSQYLQRAEGRA
jgi:hypothetical protein